MAYDHTLEIESRNGEKVSYRFEAVGFVGDKGLEPHDEVGDKYVDGWCTNRSDVIGFNTAPKAITFQEGFPHAKLTLDGESVEPFHLNMRTLKVKGHGEKSPYRFSVSPSGRIIGSDTTEWNDYVLPSKVEARGVVIGGEDTWYFSGNLVGWPDSNKKLTVVVDNKEYTYEGNPPVGAI